MENRRTFLALAAALLPIGVDAQNAAAPPRPGGDIARHALAGPFEGYEAVLSDVTLPPGRPVSASPAHRHSGFVLGCVIEGKLRFAINNEPERIVPTGGTFFEPIGALHSANGAASDGPVRFLAFLVVPKGSPVVVPA